MRDEPPAQVWIHFPCLPTRGCEGVLAVQVEGQRHHALLIDGERAQVELLARWAKTWPPNDGSTIHWVVSHYHRDHIGERNRLTEEALWGRIKNIFCPSMPRNDWPAQTGAAVRELGKKMTEMYMNASAAAPQIQPVKVGLLATIWQRGGIHAVVTGGTPSEDLPPDPHKQMNARSLIVLGMSTQGKLGKAKPFSFVLPGDAEKASWNSFEARLNEHTDLQKGLPLALLKLSHHGACDANPSRVLSRLFGALPAQREGQLAVRVLNAAKDPRGKTDVESVLKGLKVRLWDTRKEGALWIRLTYGEALFTTQNPADADLRLPVTLKQSCTPAKAGTVTKRPAVPPTPRRAKPSKGVGS